MDKCDCKKVVLLVDDSNTQLSYFRIHLSRAGFEVVTAQSATDAFMKVFEYQPDLILSDVIMPDVSGFQFCKAIKKNIVLKKIPIILFTSNIDVLSNTFWAKQAMAEKFIPKDSNIEDIVYLINALTDQYPVAPEIKVKLEQNATKASLILMENNITPDFDWMKETIVKECGHLIKYIDNTDELIRKIYDMLSLVLPYNLCCILFNQENSERKIEAYVNVNHRNIENETLQSLVNDFTQDVLKTQKQTKIVTHFTNIDDNKSQLKLDDCSNYETIPIKDNDNVVGAIRFYTSNGQYPQSVPYYEDVVNFLSHIVFNKVYNEKIKFLSYNNQNLGIYNKIQFLESLSIELARAKLGDGNMSLALMSFENYEQLVTDYGSATANRTIEKAIKVVTSSLRFPDKVYRYNHQSLLIILANVDLKRAIIPIQRINDIFDKNNNINPQECLLINRTIVIDNSVEYENAQDMLNKLVYMYSKNDSTDRILLVNDTAD